ncbi:GNAT family N-acetyltransferase [Candidatus Peregrinibacteria bacterium]|nr:GNAT family N-acetyltransferase [Candidatus Peregrinibacteria bacterium]
MEMKLRFSKFTAEDFPEYKTWYEDPALNKSLGPMDDKWLDHVMHETRGQQYSVFLEKELVAVMGILLPDAEHPAYYITDFALKPSLRNQGIGSEVLEELRKLYTLKPGETWRTFIDERNPRARAFFERNGWVCVSDTPDEHGMLLLEQNLRAN